MQKMGVPFLGLFFVLVGDNVVAVLLDVVLVVIVGVVAENVKRIEKEEIFILVRMNARIKEKLIIRI